MENEVAYVAEIAYDVHNEEEIEQMNTREMIRKSILSHLQIHALLLVRRFHEILHVVPLRSFTIETNA